MYANIPIQETLDIIDQHSQNLQCHPLEIQKIVNLLNILLKQNYFQYNNKFYIQKGVLPMGSPISSYHIGNL